MTASPALLLKFASDTPASLRDRLVAVLAEHELVAILEDDITTPGLWTAHFLTASARDAAIESLENDADFREIDARAIEVEDDDWARRTQADLPAVRIGRIIVAPPWDVPASVASGDITVLIEPSRGFGTGHHQSTRLCLALLQARELSGRTVLDVGTGSGVLAIAAAKLGAPSVNAIDSDPDAVENARENVAANRVEQIVQVHVDDLTATTTPAADIVIANLTGKLLSRHAADLARLVRPSGLLIASGFNTDERAPVVEALVQHFSIGETAEEDDWGALVGSRQPQ